MMYILGHFLAADFSSNVIDTGYDSIKVARYEIAGGLRQLVKCTLKELTDLVTTETHTYTFHKLFQTLYIYCKIS